MNWYRKHVECWIIKCYRKSLCLAPLAVRQSARSQMLGYQNTQQHKPEKDGRVDEILLYSAKGRENLVLHRSVHTGALFSLVEVKDTNRSILTLNLFPFAQREYLGIKVYIFKIPILVLEAIYLEKCQPHKKSQEYGILHILHLAFKSKCECNGIYLYWAYISRRKTQVLNLISAITSQKVLWNSKYHR